MKILIKMLIVLSSLGAQAEKNIQTTFWSASYPETSQINFKAPVENLENDCKNYQDIVSAQDLDAEIIEFNRKTPVAGSMKTHYGVYFEIISPAPVFLKNENMFFQVNLETLKNIQVILSKKSLSALSSEKGLKIDNVEFKNNASGRPSLYVSSRDLACDLITQKAKLQAQVQNTISLSANKIIEMTRFYDQVAVATTSIIKSEDDDFLKAAKLGLAYSKIYEVKKLSPDAIIKNIEFLMKNLFEPNSLKPSACWSHFPRPDFINFLKAEDTEYGVVSLEMVAP